MPGLFSVLVTLNGQLGVTFKEHAMADCMFVYKDTSLVTVFLNTFLHSRPLSLSPRPNQPQHGSLLVSRYTGSDTRAG